MERLGISMCGLRGIGLLLITLGACTDEPSGNNVDGTPRYAIGMRVFSPDFSDENSFIGFTEDLATGAVDLSDAIEIPGQASLFAPQGTGDFYVTSAEERSLQWFQFEEGRPVEVGRLGLSGFGISTLSGDVMVFDGADRGYLFDMLSGQAIEVNLEDFELVRAIDLSDWLDPTLTSFIGGLRFVPRDGEFVAVVYGTDLVQQVVSDTAQVVFFDPATGTYELQPSPCAGVHYGMSASNGDLFFASDPWVAAIHAVDDARAPAPCMIRIPAGTRTVATQTIELNALTGRPTGGLIPSGPDTAYVRALDVETFPIPDKATGLELFGAPFWQTWEIDLRQPDEAVLVDSDPELLPGGITWFESEETVYQNISSPDFTSTTLSRTTDGPGPSSGIVVPGLALQVVRLQ